jgi:hypothetical protein
MYNRIGTDDLLNGTPVGVQKQTKAHLFMFIIAACMFTCMLVFAMLEIIVGFYRNSHIFGFIMGFILFVISIALIVLLAFYYRKGQLPRKVFIIFYVLFGVGMVVFLYVGMCLSVKQMQYSQQPSRVTDFKNNNIFTKECQNIVKTCSEISVQSRVEGTKVVQEQGFQLYVQTSHTDVFFGLITDGVYYVTLGPPPEDADGFINFPGDAASIYAQCNKRIANAPTACGHYWTDFEKCLTKNDNENFLKCTPQAP